MLIPSESGTSATIPTQEVFREPDILSRLTSPAIKGIAQLTVLVNRDDWDKLHQK